MGVGGSLMRKGCEERKAPRRRHNFWLFGCPSEEPGIHPNPTLQLLITSDSLHVCLPASPSYNALPLMAASLAVYEYNNCCVCLSLCTCACLCCCLGVALALQPRAEGRRERSTRLRHHHTHLTSPHLIISHPSHPHLHAPAPAWPP